MSDWHPSIPDPDECRSRLDRLEARQRQVLQLCVYGYTTKEIGRRLGITQKTVHNHLNAIYRKLDTQSLTHAVLSAVRLGIIDLDAAGAAAG